jgi:hypothetical protein
VRLAIPPPRQNQSAWSARLDLNQRDPRPERGAMGRARRLADKADSKNKTAKNVHVVALKNLQVIARFFLTAEHQKWCPERDSNPHDVSIAGS